MSGERTEKPTAQRLKEARKQGQIARSRDLAIAAASVAVDDGDGVARARIWSMA